MIGLRAARPIDSIGGSCTKWVDLTQLSAWTRVDPSIAPLRTESVMGSATKAQLRAPDPALAPTG